MADPEMGERPAPSWHDSREAFRSRNRHIWYGLSGLSWVITYSVICWVIIKVYTEDDFHIRLTLAICAVIYSYSYLCVLYFVTYGNKSLPRVLRRFEKLLLESGFVVVSASWCYYQSHRNAFISSTILGLVLSLNSIPIMNLWWYFENIGFYDCCLILLIDAALVLCRHNAVHLTAVAGVGVALQLMKDAYRQYTSQKIKHSSDKHFI